jgi:predicted nucleic acid-binding Zn ribbon protein
LKGGGWYVTDYHGSHGGRATAPGSPEAGSKAAEGSESSPKTTETEAAGKTEAPAPAKKFK